jgi:uncharacterized protein YpiB (UPF0302 family)
MRFVKKIEFKRFFQGNYSLMKRRCNWLLPVLKKIGYLQAGKIP